jgi:hypothetical protein
MGRVYILDGSVTDLNLGVGSYQSSHLSLIYFDAKSYARR